MTESAMSTISSLEDPWNSPSAMGITPPMVCNNPKVQESLPTGSQELQKIIREMYEEIEFERHRALCRQDSDNRRGKRKLKRRNTRIPTRIKGKALIPEQTGPDGQSLAETNRRMLENEIFCDVVFIAGANKTPVRAHRCILASRSPVFYTMFCGMLAEKDCVNVPDIDPDVLKYFFMYLYTGSVDITGDTGLGLLYASEKYGEEDLKAQCYKYLQSNIDIESVCPVLTHAMAIGQDDLVSKCLSFIYNHVGIVLQNKHFVELPKEALQMIIVSDQLDAPEIDIHKACMRWAQYQCEKQNLEACDVNFRQIFGDLIFSIRYPLFSDSEFKDNIETSSLLSDEEKHIILEIKHGTIPDNAKFLCLPRYHKFSPLTNGSFFRYESIIKTYSYSNITDLVCFSCSHNVLLTEVYIFAPSDAGSLRGEMIIYDNKMTLLKQAFTVPCHSTQPISLASPIILKAQTEYYIEHTCFGPATYNGMNGKKEITIDGVTLTFTSSEKVKDSMTYEDTAHLGGLKFS